MSLWRQVTRGLRVLADRRAADRDVDDEVRHYLDQAAAELVAGGLSPDAARRAARVGLGNETAVREQVRSYGWENGVGTVLADLRYAARRLRSSPGFAAVSVLTLALGMGASTAMFSAVNPVLFEPLPYPNAGRVAMVWDVANDGSRLDVTFGTFRELLERSRSFTAMAVVRPWQPTVVGTERPERLEGQRVTASYFRVLGVPPALGRDFQEADEHPNGPRVVILSHGLWQRRFGGDREIVGRQITLDGDEYSVLGVMPRRFENVLAPAAQLWAPLRYDVSLPVQGREWGHHLRMVGRLRADVGLDQATRELALIARTPVAEFARVPWASLTEGLIVDRLQDDLTRSVKPALLAVLGAVVLVLLIACVNVTNLLLARGAQRRGEFAVRAALGAGRARPVRQLLTESLLLAALGGALGMVVALFGVRALVALSPPELPRVGAIGLDGAVFAFALAVTTLVGVGVGLVPALHASRSDLHGGLREGSRRTTGGHLATRGALVVAEVALALVLLVSAGLLLRSLQRLFAVAPGFDAAPLLTMQVQTSGHRFDDDSATHRFFAQALDAVRRVPGFSAAAFTSQLPLSGDANVYGVRFESLPNDDPEGGEAFRYAITPGYFETMGIPLRRGRLLDARDLIGAQVPVLINESYAKRVFRGADPIGQRLQVGPEDAPWQTVVGVVGDVKQASLAVSQGNAVYIPSTRWPYTDRALWLVVRARGDVAALTPSVMQAVWSVDKDQPIVRASTMSDMLAASAAERRFALVVFEAFALVALVLAATGIYGVLSGGVSERLREIGVRTALGASRGDILALVVRQGMTLTGLGVVLGLSAAAAASQLLVTLLFGVSRLDPATYVGVIALLFAVSGLACWVPAWRAARVDPSITLRAE
jgi:putative ABC transport system permease protein